MINVEDLYYDKDFNSFLKAAISRNIAYFNPVSNREDYIQDIYSEIIERGCNTIDDCKRAAWHVLNDERRNMKNQVSSMLWEDNHNIEVL